MSRVTFEQYWQWVKTYTSWGWAVLPMRGKATPKGLRWTEYRDMPPRWDEWLKWVEEYDLKHNAHRFGIGVLTKPSSMWVVDIDDMSYWPPLSPHFSVHPRYATRRGLHILMKAFPLPEGLEGCSRLVIELLDTKVELLLNTITPLPPSPHQDDPTFRYRWEIPPSWRGELPPPPAVLVRALELLDTDRKVDKLICEWPEEYEKHTGQSSKKGIKVPFSKITAVLEELGIRWKEDEVYGIPILRLSRCPLCQQTDSGAWLWKQTGTLRCFGMRRCPAAQKPKGLKFSEWAEEALGRLKQEAM